ncbi:MAG: transposase [Ferrimicrobium sp.]
MNLVEITRRFSSESACEQYLCQLCWEEEFYCSKCYNTELMLVRSAPR